MAWESLADFFSVYHRCDDWELQKAVIHCAHGPYGDTLRKAATSWQPKLHFHQNLRRNIFDPPPLTRGQITPTVTQLRKTLVHWLSKQYPLPKPPKPQPLQISTLWDILNATDRYSKADIKGSICIAMYGDYGDNDAWKPALQAEARWRTAASAWERELISFMLAETPADPRPQPRTSCMYNQAKRIRAYLRRSGTHSPVCLTATDGRPKRTERTYG